MNEENPQEWGERRRRREAARQRSLAEQEAQTGAAGPVRADSGYDAPGQVSRRELRRRGDETGAPQFEEGPTGMQPEARPQSRRDRRVERPSPQFDVSAPPATGGIRRIGPNGQLSGVESAREVQAPRPDPRAEQARAQAEQAQIERERVARERILAAQERAARERAERERQEQARRDERRLERERAEREQQAHLEQLRQEQAQREHARQEQARAEHARQEQIRQEQLRREQLRREQLRREQLRHEQARTPAPGASRPGPNLGTHPAAAPDFQGPVTDTGNLGDASVIRRGPTAQRSAAPRGDGRPVGQPVENAEEQARIAQERAARIAHERAEHQRVLEAERAHRESEQSRANRGGSAHPMTGQMATRSPVQPGPGPTAGEPTPESGPIAARWPSRTPGNEAVARRDSALGGRGLGTTGEMPVPGATSAMPNPVHQQEAAPERAAAAPAAGPSPFPIGSEPDEDFDDDLLDEPPGRSAFSWLHWLVLIVVAFALGMLIVLVITREAAADTPAALAAAATAAVWTGW
jgi:hypothetical protein